MLTLILIVFLFGVRTPSAYAADCSWLPSFCHGEARVPVWTSRCCPSCSTEGTTVYLMCTSCDRIICDDSVPSSEQNISRNPTPAEFSLVSHTSEKTPSLPPSLRLEGYFAGRAFQQIAAGAFASVPLFERVDLSRNELMTIGPASFSGLEPYLTDLNLSYNRLTRVTEGVFSYFEVLVTLRLTGNAITVLRPSLNNNTTLWPWALHTLYLDNNRIHTIKTGALDGLPNLSWLHLGGNRLASLGFLCGISPPLTQLDTLRIENNELGEGNFGRIGMASCLKMALPALRTLDVSNNMIQSDSFTSKLGGALRSLNMRNNSLLHVDACVFASAQLEGNSLVCSCDMARLYHASLLPCSDLLTGRKFTVSQYVDAMCPEVNRGFLFSKSSCGRMSVNISADAACETFSVQWETSKAVVRFVVEAIIPPGVIMRTSVKAESIRDSGEEVSPTVTSIAGMFTGQIPMRMSHDGSASKPVTMLVCITAVRNNVPAVYGQKRCQPIVIKPTEALCGTLEDTDSVGDMRSNRTDLSASEAKDMGEFPLLALVFICLFAGLLVIFLLTVLCLTKMKGTRLASVFLNGTYGDRTDTDANIYGKPLGSEVGLNSPEVAAVAGSRALAGSRQVEGREDPVYEEMSECITGGAEPAPRHFQRDSGVGGPRRSTDSDSSATMAASFAAAAEIYKTKSLEAQDESSVYFNSPAAVRDSYESDNANTSDTTAIVRQTSSSPEPSIPYVPASVLELPSPSRDSSSRSKTGASSVSPQVPSFGSVSKRRGSGRHDQSVHYLYTHIAHGGIGETDDSDPRLSDSLYEHNTPTNEEQSVVDTAPLTFNKTASKKSSSNSGSLSPAVVALNGPVARAAAAAARGNLSVRCGKPRRHQSVSSNLYHGESSDIVKGRAHLYENGVKLEHCDAIKGGSVRVAMPTRRHSLHKEMLDAGKDRPPSAYTNAAFSPSSGQKEEEEGKNFF